MNNSMIDFHCHPSLKPYGKSFSAGTPGENTISVKSKTSIWYYDPPNLLTRALQSFTGIVKFRQADIPSLAFGNMRIICASLYPIEQKFFKGSLGDGFLSDLGNSFVTSVGKERVDYIQGIKDYFEDLQREYGFYAQLDGKTASIAGGKYKYIMAKSYEEISNYMTMNPDDVNTVFIIMTIEGMHSLNDDVENALPSQAMFIKNLEIMKTWPHTPFFVTVAHHFYNHLCGHAKSLEGIVGSVTDQSEGLNTGFTDTGLAVVKKLLSKDNGKRVYIDIKHMSALARKQYINLLATDYAGEKIPLVVSHGAANGVRSADEPVIDGKDTAYKLLAEDINFYDNEILEVAKSGGIFCIQLDERRVASEETLKAVKHSLFMNKIRHYRSELLWNQLQHIAELLDRHDMFAWDCIAIGSDFDGVINPLNGFLTEEVMPNLLEYLERHAFNYMSNRGKTLLKSYNQIDSSEIVNRVFSSNGISFVKKWYV